MSMGISNIHTYICTYMHTVSLYLARLPFSIHISYYKTLLLVFFFFSVLRSNSSHWGISMHRHRDTQLQPSPHHWWWKRPVPGVFHSLKRRGIQTDCETCLSLNLLTLHSNHVSKQTTWEKNNNIWQRYATFHAFPNRVFPNNLRGSKKETKGEICRLSLPSTLLTVSSHLRWYSWHLGVFTFHIYQHGATIHTGNRAVIAMLETMKVTDQSVKFDDMLNLLYVQGFGALISWY